MRADVAMATTVFLPSLRKTLKNLCRAHVCVALVDDLDLAPSKRLLRMHAARSTARQHSAQHVDISVDMHINSKLSKAVIPRLPRARHDSYIRRKSAQCMPSHLASYLAVNSSNLLWSPIPRYKKHLRISTDSRRPWQLFCVRSINLI